MEREDKKLVEIQRIQVEEAWHREEEIIGREQDEEAQRFKYQELSRE